MTGDGVDDMRERLEALAKNLRGLVDTARRKFSCPSFIDTDDVLYTSLIPVEEATRPFPIGSSDWRNISTAIVRRTCINVMRSWIGRRVVRKSVHMDDDFFNSLLAPSEWDPVTVAVISDEVDYLQQLVGFSESFTALLRTCAHTGQRITPTLVAQSLGCGDGSARYQLRRLHDEARRIYPNAPLKRGCACS